MAAGQAPSFGLPENLPHLLHEFRGIVNLKTSRPTILQIDDQVLPAADRAGKDEPLDGSRPHEVAEFHRRNEIVGGEASLPDGGHRLRQSPPGQVQYPIQRHGHREDDAGYLSSVIGALPPRRRLRASTSSEAALSDSARKTARVPTESSRPPQRAAPFPLNTSFGSM